jgi:hypothetical protein
MGNSTPAETGVSRLSGGIGLLNDGDPVHVEWQPSSFA